MNRFSLVLVAVLVLAGCEKASPPNEAVQTAAVLSGDAKSAVSDNPLCKLFSATELATYSGMALGTGRNVAMGSGCQWLSPDETGVAMVQVVPLDYAVDPDGAPGYRAVPEVGKGGYVLPESDGWSAGASFDKSSSSSRLTVRKRVM